MQTIQDINFRLLKKFFLLVDLGFILYWTVTYLHLIPNELLFSNYNNPLVVSWNWSFVFIDLLTSITGLVSLVMYSKQNYLWFYFAFISLVLTSASGTMAIGYWIINREFELGWWLPNLFLIIYPLFFIPRFMRVRVV
jgi:hypothetical protein